MQGPDFSQRPNFPNGRGHGGVSGLSRNLRRYGLRQISSPRSVAEMGVQTGDVPVEGDMAPVTTRDSGA